MATELYKRMRPKTLDRIVGNADVVRFLRNMTEKGTLPHTIMFTGPSGCGKTSLARILKGMLQCADIDYREINSSNNRGVDTIRDIQSRIDYAPAAGPCRIYLFDEAHKMTNDAQNAALKMLEDTPDHVYFFICTTDPGKIIKAVQNRCYELPVRGLVESEMDELIHQACKKDKTIALGAGAREAMIEAAQGSARALLVMLEMVGALPPADQAKAIQDRAAEANEAIALCRALINKEPWPRVAGILANMKGEPEEIRYAVLGYARAVLINPKSGNSGYQAYLVIDCFKDNFYDSKAAGLARAAYEVVNAK